MRYMFEMTLHKVALKTPYEQFQVKVVLMKQAKRVETTTNPMMGKDNPIGDFKDEKLPLISTIHREKATKKFKDRKGNMIIQITMNEKVKSVGVVTLNLVDFIDQANAPTKNGSRQQMKLDKCPDPKAYVEFTVRSVLISANATGAETISLGSDGFDGPDSEFNFGDIDKESINKERSSRVMARRNRGQSSTAAARSEVIS